MSTKKKPQEKLRRRPVRSRAQLKAALDAAERPVSQLVQDIRSGQTNANDLSAGDRRQCVQYLGAEGLSVPEIAQLMGVSDRTIARDRAKIQERAALHPDPAMAGQFAGRLMAEAEACMNRVRRVTRDRETPPAVKVDGERACFEILCRLSEQLQRLGFLPNFGGQMQIDVHQHGDQVPSYEELEGEIHRLGQAVEADQENTAAIKQLEELETLVHRAKLAEGVKVVKSTISERL